MAAKRMPTKPQALKPASPSIVKGTLGTAPSRAAWGYGNPYIHMGSGKKRSRDSK